MHWPGSVTGDLVALEASMLEAWIQIQALPLTTGSGEVISPFLNLSKVWGLLL